jgi:nitroreductase
MPTPVSAAVLDQAFLQARTFNKFTNQPVTDEVLHQLYDLAKWGPTAMNSQPARFVFVRSAEAKARLKPSLSPNNADKTMAAPVTVIVATDSQFFEHLPTQFPAYDAKPMFEGNPAMAQGTASLNGSLQGAYLIIAARMLGLDCGPMAGFDKTKVDAEFFADGRYKSSFLINLGYGDASGNHPRGPRLAFETAAQAL